MKKLTVSTLLLGFLVFPTVVNAAWWNPFSWRIFNQRNKVETIAPIIVPPSQDVVSKEQGNSVQKESVVKKDIPKEGTKKQVSEPVVQQKPQQETRMCNGVDYINNCPTGTTWTCEPEIKQPFCEKDTPKVSSYEQLMNQLDNQISKREEEQSARENSPECVEAKKKKQTYDSQGSAIEKEYQKIIENIKQSAISQEAINQQVSDAEREKIRKLADLSIQNNSTYSNYAAYCYGVYGTTQIPTARYNDGTTSYSQTRSGTCSYHGGVYLWF